MKNYFDSPAQAADYFGIPERTARDWYRKSQAQNTAKRLMNVAASGFLPCSLGWEDFRIFNGRLYTPTGQCVTPEQLNAICQAFDLPQYERVQKWLNGRRTAKVPDWVIEEQTKSKVLSFK